MALVYGKAVLSPQCTEPTMATKKKKNLKRNFLESACNLSVLGYCRIMAMQYGGLCERGLAPPVDISIKVSFYGNKPTASLSFS